MQCVEQLRLLFRAAPWLHSRPVHRRAQVVAAAKSRQKIAESGQGKQQSRKVASSVPTSSAGSALAPVVGMREFYGCYLLTSLDPKNKGRTYIGFTVNPRRRLRQHNGEITAGAHKTKRGRPWDMVLVVYGFPTKVQALQFEWAWQHPVTSKAVRAAAERLGKTAMQGAKGKVRLLFEMLNLDPWCYYPLTVQMLSSSYTPLRAKCLAPPAHVAVTTAPMEVLPVVVEDDFDEGPPAEHDEDDSLAAASMAIPEPSLSSDHASLDNTASTNPTLSDAAIPVSSLPGSDTLTAKELRAAAKAEAAAARAAAKAVKEAEAAAKQCAVCGEMADSKWLSCTCSARSHIECLAKRFLREAGEQQGLPVQGTCPSCGKPQMWADMLARGESVPWRQKRQMSGRGRKKAAASPKRSPQKVNSGKAKQAAADSSTASTLADPDPSPTKKPRRRTVKASASAQTLAEAADPDATSPTKKPRRRQTNTAATATAEEAAAALAAVPKARKASSKGTEVKAKGRKAKPKAAADQEAEPELPKGPSSIFEVDHVLSLGSGCGLSTNRGTRDELSAHRQTWEALSRSHSSASLAADAEPNNFTPYDSQHPLSVDGVHDQPTESFTQHGLDSSTVSTLGPQLSPQEVLADLPLRDRLQKIQALLLEAGIPRAQALLAPQTAPYLPSAENAEDLGLLNCQQQHEGHEDGSNAAAHTEAGSVVPSRDAGMYSSPPRAGRHMSSEVIHQEMICLITPSPASSSALPGQDVLDSLALDLDAQQLSEQRLTQSASPGINIQSVPYSDHSNSSLDAVSPPLYQQQQQPDVAGALSAMTKLLSSPEQVPHTMPDIQMAGTTNDDSVPESTLADHSKDGLLSSPSSAEASRQGKKRTRSLSRARKGNTKGSASQNVADRSAPLHSVTSSQQRSSPQHTDALLIEDTPQGKTVMRLAALQFNSPGYTPSPVPLRRRLQGHPAAFASQQIPDKQATHDVICIDC